MLELSGYGGFGMNGFRRISPGSAPKTSCDDTDHLLFVGCTTVSIGNGKEMSFWHSGWLQGPRPKDIADCSTSLQDYRPKNRTVVAALQRQNWIRDIRRADGLTVTHLQEYLTHWECFATFSCKRTRRTKSNGSSFGPEITRRLRHTKHSS